MHSQPITLKGRLQALETVKLAIRQGANGSSVIIYMGYVLIHCPHLSPIAKLLHFRQAPFHKPAQGPLKITTPNSSNMYKF